MPCRPSTPLFPLFPLLLALLTGPGLLPARAERSAPPNFLLVMTDDQGWWDLGSSGNPVIRTPVMDSLAREGVRFDRFYVEPVCSPTRAGLMTGRYFLRTGLYNTRFGGDTIHASEITLAEALKPRGYRTGLFGKWHLGRYAPNHPNSQGFDEYLGFLEGHTERYDYPDLMHNREPVQARGYITDRFTEAAMGFIRRHRDRPWFCYLAYNVPHTPLIVGDAHGLQERGDKLIEHYLAQGLELREARIYAMIERCDQELGRVLKLLRELDLERDTVVVFMHDNGGISRHWKGGLKGGKASVYEGGVRSPLFIRWPDRFPAGSRVQELASHVDIFPTLCELAGAEVPDDRPIDGRSLVPLLRNSQAGPVHQYVYHHWDRYYPNTTNRWAVSGTRWKLAQGRLYDLESDPGEAANVASKHPEKVRALRAEFVRWFEDVTSGQTYEPAPIPIGLPEENPVEIQTSWAQLVGEGHSYTFLGYHWDTVEAWKSPDQQAVWKLDIRRAGTYEVEVSYGAEAASAGSIFELAVGRQSVRATVEATLDRNAFIRRTVGTLTLQPGPARLVVHPVEVKGDELMALNRIWLRRID